MEDWLTGVRVHLDGDIDKVERKKLRRYIVAYNGEIESQLSDRTTHLVSKDGVSSNDDSKLSDHPDIKVVKPQWIWDSISQKEILPEESYLV